MSTFNNGTVAQFGAVVSALCGAVYTFSGLQTMLVRANPTGGWGGATGAARLRLILREASTHGIVRTLAPGGCCNVSVTTYALNGNLMSSNYSAYLSMKPYCNSFSKKCGSCLWGCR